MNNTIFWEQVLTSLLYSALHLLLKIKKLLNPKLLEHWQSFIIYCCLYIRSNSLKGKKHIQTYCERFSKEECFHMQFIRGIFFSYYKFKSDTSHQTNCTDTVLVSAAFKSQVGSHFVFVQRFHHWGDTKCSWAFQIQNQQKLSLKSSRLALPMYIINLIGNW